MTDPTDPTDPTGLPGPTLPVAGAEPAALVLDRVHLTVDDGATPRHVLAGVSLQLRTGELVAVMGPSGAGKSTLVDISCGLTRPTSGTVHLLGSAPGGSGSWWADRRRDSIGIVHQRLNLLAGMSALDNVALALDLRGQRRAAARRAAATALDRVGIRALGGTRVERLSVGEQQRVAIARAIAGDRPVILADEPAAALDRTTADLVAELLADLASEGRAVLLVTHDAQQASWASRTILLRDGAVIDEISAAATIA